MGLKDVHRLIDSDNREIVYQATWGHLAPKKNTTYRGEILFAVGCYGNDHLNPTLLRVDIGGLDDSPWFFDVLNEMLTTLAIEDRIEEGSVYRMKVTFRNYQFWGSANIVTI